VDAAEHGNRLGVHLLGHLQQPLGLVDRRRDRGAADDVGLLLGQDFPELVVRDVVGHGVDEAQVGVACRLQRSGQVGHPGRRPVAGDLGASRVVVGMQEENAHDTTLDSSDV
jgi:hypothetical protein